MSTQKKVVATLKLEIPAQQATPAPPIGPALGQKQVNIKEFCDIFNQQTKHIEKGVPTPVIIEVYQNKKFSIQLKKPTVSYYILKECKLDKGSSEAGRSAEVGSITEKQCLYIAQEKIEEMNTDKIESAVKIVKGSAKSMGIKIVS